MFKNIESYEKFLEKQFVERQNFLKEVSTKMVDELTDHLKSYGWERKGKGGGLSGDKIKGVKYTKTFNGKVVTIEYRNNLRLDGDGLLYFRDGGYNEFVHNELKKSFTYKEVVSLIHFNSQKSLDDTLKQIDKFYSKNVK